MFSFRWLAGSPLFLLPLAQLIFSFLLFLSCWLLVSFFGLFSAAVVLEAVRILLKNKRMVILMSNIYQLIVPVLLFMIFMRLGDKNRA